MKTLLNHLLNNCLQALRKLTFTFELSRQISNTERCLAFGRTPSANGDGPERDLAIVFHAINTAIILRELLEHCLHHDVILPVRVANLIKTRSVKDDFQIYMMDLTAYIAKIVLRRCTNEPHITLLYSFAFPERS